MYYDLTHRYNKDPFLTNYPLTMVFRYILAGVCYFVQREERTSDNLLLRSTITWINNQRLLCQIQLLLQA